MKRIANAEAELHYLLQQSAGRNTFVCAISQSWLTPATPLDIAVFAESCAGSLHLVLSDNVERASRCDATSTLAQIAELLGTAVFDLSRPMLLRPVHIPKPWGQEIWFTGVEARGVCHFAQNGGSAPIPWLLQICGSLLYGNADSTLVLLKILDPLAEAVFGDLYVELHEKKQEVYVVTHIDETAWPEGIGGIRFGFNQTKRAQFSDDAAFRAAYLAAVRQYRAVRFEIDTLLDAMRVKAGIALDAAVSASQQKTWLADVAPHLQTQEQALRVAMDSFYGHLPLKLGDVIKVPCLVPHSLQHGVRTIEFQTPVYERKILSFAQKVLTQAHWDTEQAMTLSQITPAMGGELESVPSVGGATVERIVDFDTFEVFRISLEAGKTLALDTLSTNRSYLEVMTVSGQISAAGAILPPSDALLIPHKCPNKTLIASSEAAVVVVACPKAHPVY
jgi:mannose-6-phosphate isomerase class I